MPGGSNRDTGVSANRWERTDSTGETLAPDPGLARLTEAERREYADLNAKVSTRDPDTGLYPHWTQRERDRVRELMRKMGPIEFAPSTEEMARRFGHRSRRDAR